MFFTRAAVADATSLAACIKCFLATGLLVLLEACLQAWHNVLVCLAMIVAAASTCRAAIIHSTTLNVIHSVPVLVLKMMTAVSGKQLISPGEHVQT